MSASLKIFLSEIEVNYCGEISLENVAKCNVSLGRILSFGKYGRFCGIDSSPSDVNLNGKLEFTSTNSYFYNLNISSGSGIVDMGKIRECSISATSVAGLSGNIYDISISSSASPTVYLPFNCKFSNVDLSNASNIYYTILKITKVGVDENIIKKVTGTYGDYADSNNNLGVTLPKNRNGTVNTNKVHITEETQDEAHMSLSELVEGITTYNISGAGYYLLTDHLDDVADTIAAGAIHDYNFGFIGEKAVSIIPEEEAENTKATFKGDNRGYNPGTPATISAAEVVFGASDSLFPFSYNYVKGTFTKGNFTNTIPANKTTEFTNGFTLGLGHTLIVSGTLIG